MSIPQTLLTWLALTLTMAGYVAADFPCICCYAVDTQLYSKPDLSAPVVGHMYEFDCKARYLGTPDLDSAWDVVMIDHQIGYLEMNSAMSSDTCPGVIPPEDKVTTPIPTSSTSTTTQSASTVTTASTTVPQSTASTPATSKPKRPSTTVLTTPAGITDSPTTSTVVPLVTGKVSYSSPAPSTTIGSNTPSTTTASTTSTSSTPSTTSTSPTTTTATTTTSTTPTPTTTKSTTTTSTSTTRPTTTSTTTTPTTTSSTTSTTTPTTTTRTTTTTTKPTTTTTTPKPTPHVNPVTQAPQTTTYKCPDNVISAAQYNKGATGVYGSTCYELVPSNHPWQYAENNCRHKGGHLVHIQNMDEENHVTQFLNDNRYSHAVWIGLTDLPHESYFTWTSGDPVTFTRWLPGHTSNFMNHHYEDCVVLVPYIRTGFMFSSHVSRGLWDDIHCSEGHPWICQHPAVPTTPSLNSIFGNIGQHVTNSNHHIHFTTKFPVHSALANMMNLIGRK